MSAVNNLRLGTHHGPTVIGSVTNLALDGSGIALAWICDAQTTSAITTFSFRYGAATGTPPSYVLTLEGVDASGNPDGTDKGGGGSPTAKIFTPPASTAWDGTHQDIVLTNPYSPASKDEVLAWTIRYSSGTVSASHNSSFSRGFQTALSGLRGFPMSSTLSGGVWTKTTLPPNFTYNTASEQFGMPILAAYVTLTANTAGHRSAAQITIPAALGTSVSLAGVHALMRTSAGGSYKLCVWDSSWTELASRTIDSDLNGGVGSHRGMQLCFASPITLTCGTTYRIGFECVSGAIGMLAVQCDSSDDIRAYPNGENSALVTWNGTTTTVNATHYPLIDLILSDVTAPSGGSVVPIGIHGLSGMGSF